MATFNQTDETRIIFRLERDNVETTRAIVLPGIPVEDADVTTVKNNFHDFYESYMNGRVPAGGASDTKPRDFFQPATWRDAIGSYSGAYPDLEMVDDNPWTTTDIEIEFIRTEKTRFVGSTDFDDGGDTPVTVTAGI